MKAQTDVLDEFVPSINVEASIVAGHLRPFEGAQRRICHSENFFILPTIYLLLWSRSVNSDSATPWTAAHHGLSSPPHGLQHCLLRTY